MYLSGTTNINFAYSLLTGMLFWQIAFIMQYSVSVGSLWNIWSHNLSNMFIAPMTLFEYMCTQACSGIVKASLVFFTTAFLSATIFGFNILGVGMVNIFFYFTNMTLFAFAFGLAMLGLIFRYGTRIQAFAWGILPILQPLSAAFYPVSIMPQPLQIIARLLPPTYVFEAIRANFVSPGIIQWGYISIAFMGNFLFLIFSVIFFRLMFNKSKESGQFAKLES